VGIEELYLKIIKAIYHKPTGDIMLDGEKMKVFLLRSGKRMYTPTTAIQRSFESSNHSNLKRKRNKRRMFPCGTVG